MSIMSSARRTALVVGSLVFCACHTTSAQPDVPALITDPTADSRAELHRAVTAALNDVPVTLADDALTEVSLLVIERAPPRNLDDRPLTGRVLETPVQFRLVLSGSSCVLVQLADGRRWELPQTTCRPE